jgi:hypothetical protein
MSDPNVSEAWEKNRGWVPGFCRWCKTNQVPDRNLACLPCRAVLHGPLIRANYQLTCLKSAFSTCCEGLAEEAPGDPYIWFHSEDFNGHWPAEGDTELAGMGTVTVEVGVQLHQLEARVYYTVDQANSVDSVRSGDPIPYRDREFSSKLAGEICLAPMHAWNNGLRTCDQCGNHYHLEEGGCPWHDDQEDEKDEESDAGG